MTSSGAAATTTRTLSCLPKSPPNFTKTSQLFTSQKRNHHFKVSCQAKDGEQNASRRNLLIGLGGLYGAASLANDPFALAAPVSPDFPNFHPANLPEGARKIDCCPPVPTTPPVDFKLPRPSTLRVRPAAHLADKAYMAKFERAIQMMNGLPPNDPRNFTQQAHVHCAYCNGAYDQVGFPNPQLQVHGSWLLFAYHRLYLYFFERIFGKLLNDTTFAVPFWNWDAQGGITIPARYTDRTSSLFDALLDAPHQPPTLIDLDYNSKDLNLPDRKKVSRNLKIMYRHMVSNARTPTQLFGCSYSAGDEPSERRAGLVENVPQNTVHDWTGDRAKENGEDMGALYSAGNDHIFFLHLSNVDRMWCIWKTLGGRLEDITDPDWLNSSFLFYDENAQLVCARVRDCLDTTKLGYRYQDVDIPWLNSRPTPRLSKAERQLKKLAASKAADNQSSQDIFPAKLDKAVKVILKRPLKKRSKKEKDEKDEILVIQKIALDTDKLVKFDVFINDDDDPEITPEKTEFAGSFVNVPHGHGKQIKTNLTLSLTEILEGLDGEDDEDILVTLVPRVGCGEVTVGGIKIGFD